MSASVADIRPYVCTHAHAHVHTHEHERICKIYSQWADRSIAEAASCDRAHESFVMSKLQSSLPLGDQWEGFLAGLPKVNKKEYAGDARAKKAHLEERKRILADDFFHAYCDGMRSISAAWMSDVLQGRLIERVKEVLSWVAEARRQLSVAVAHGKELIADHGFEAWASSFHKVYIYLYMHIYVGVYVLCVCVRVGVGLHVFVFVLR